MHSEMLELYQQQTKCLVALDSIIFGFDGEKLKLLLVHRGIEPDKDTWSLMGGWLLPSESLDQAADRILFELTGLKEVYLEQTMGLIKLMIPGVSIFLLKSCKKISTLYI